MVAIKIISSIAKTLSHTWICMEKTKYLQIIIPQPATYFLSSCRPCFSFHYNGYNIMFGSECARIDFSIQTSKISWGNMPPRPPRFARDFIVYIYIYTPPILCHYCIHNHNGQSCLSDFTAQLSNYMNTRSLMWNDSWKPYVSSKVFIVHLYIDCITTYISVVGYKSSRLNWI